MLFPSDEEIRSLALAELFEPLSLREIEELSWKLPDITLGAGEILYAPEQPKSGMLFVLRKGRVRIYRVLGGRELTLSMVRPGEIFGDVGPTCRYLQEAYAQATEPSELSAISRADLRELVMEHPEVGMKLADLFCRKLYLQERLMLDITFKEVPARLASIILYLAETEGVKSQEGNILIPTPYTHEQLASMIGAKRVAVTRAFKLLREEGAVVIKQRRLHVKDPFALRRIAMR